MAGRRYGSFRSGDIAESLGVALLRTIAVVSDVPRQEDVGIDAVASLLRAEADGSLYAEDTFTVQFKSWSSQGIRLSAHEVDWFMSLSLPHFVGRVDRENARLDLFTTHFGRHAVLAGSVKELQFNYDRQAAQQTVLESVGYAHYLKDDAAIAWLGEPVIQLSLCQDEVSPAQTYLAMKSFLRAERIALQFAHLGVMTALAWETNKGIVGVRQVGFHGRRPDEGLPDLVGYAAPLMIGLVGYGLSIGRCDSENHLPNAIASVANALAKAGVGDGSHGVFTYWESIYKELLLRDSAVAN